MKNDEFKRKTDDFLTKPPVWDDMYSGWDDIELTFDELGSSPEELVREKSGGKRESALKILKDWFLAHADRLPAIFEDTSKYRNLVVQMALVLLYPGRSKIVIDWLDRELIRRIDFKSWSRTIPGFGVDDLKQEARIHLVTKVINDIRWIEKRIEPYLRACINNLLANLYNKEWAQKRTGRKRDDQERREQETIIWFKKTLEEKNDLPVTEISGSLESDEEKIPSSIPLDLQQLLTERQLEIALQRDQGFSYKEIARAMGINEKMVGREIREIKKILRQYYQQM